MAYAPGHYIENKSVPIAKMFRHPETGKRVQVVYLKDGRAFQRMGHYYEHMAGMCPVLTVKHIKEIGIDWEKSK